MKEFVLTLDLKDDPESIKAYVAHHQKVWPEVEAALKSVGVIEMEIWILGNRLFMRYTAPNSFDPEADMARYLTVHPKIKEWEELMSQFQQPLPQSKKGEKWLGMEKIYHLK